MALLYRFVKRRVVIHSLLVNISSVRNKYFNLFDASSYGCNINWTVTYYWWG